MLSPTAYRALAESAQAVMSFDQASVCITAMEMDKALVFQQLRGIGHLSFVASLNLDKVPCHGCSPWLVLTGCHLASQQAERYLQMLEKHLHTGTSYHLGTCRPDKWKPALKLHWHSIYFQTKRRLMILP